MDEITLDGSHPDRRTILRDGSRALVGMALIARSGSVGAREGKTNLMDMTARDLASAIRSRRISCVDVMQASLAQIDRLNPAANAIVSLRPHDELLAEAKARDDQLTRGEAVGPLFGLPHAVKDLQPVKGLPFTAGSLLYKDRIAPADSLMTERLRKAGVIFIGKTNTPEFGFGSHTVNPVFGATHNAYDPSRSAGGSSGGAGVALTLRMVPLADGSDYGGSLRNPAGWNNVCGFRTSFGCVPSDGPEIWLPSMGVAGPMARNVADLALLLSVQAGYDPRAPLSMEGSGARFADPPAASPTGKRIGWLGDLGGAVPYEAGVLDVCQAALARFRTLGCTVEEAKPDFDVERAWQAFMTIRAWQQSGNLVPFAKDAAKRAQLGGGAQYELNLAERIGALDITAASTVRTSWSRAVQTLFSRFDFLVMPTAQLFPFPIEQRWPTQIAGQTMRSYHEWMKGVCLVSLAGVPALAVPAGFSTGGLPMGIQIIAPIHAEMACLQMGAAFEAVDPLWKNRPPPVLASA